MRVLSLIALIAFSFTGFAQFETQVETTPRSRELLRLNSTSAMRTYLGVGSGTNLVVDTFNEMATLPNPVNGRTVICGDIYKGGIFYMTNTVANTNTGTRLAMSTAGWSVQRLYEGDPSVKWFGALGDGVTDDTAAFQATADYIESLGAGKNKEIYVPQSSGDYIISSISIKCGMRGEGNFVRGQRLLYGFPTLRHKAGATNDMIIVNGNGTRKSGTFSRLQFHGRPETNIRNPVTITAVTSRTNITVATASVPSYTPIGSFPYYGIATLYSDENRFIGTAMIHSVNAGTGEIYFAEGTDDYATKTGASDLLTVGFKICFPQEHTVTLVNASTYSQFSSAKAGYAAIRGDYCSGLTIEDCSFYVWHTGVVFHYDDTLKVSNSEFYGCHFASIARGMSSVGSDYKISGVIIDGKYIAEIGLSAESNTYDRTLLRRAHAGISGIPVQSVLNNIVSGQNIRGATFELSGNVHITDFLSEASVKEALWFMRGPSSAPVTGPAVVDRLRILDKTETMLPPTLRTNVAAIRVNGPYNRVQVNNVTAGRWPAADGTWNWDYLYFIEAFYANAGTTSLRIQSLYDPDNMITADKSSTSAYATWDVHSNTTINGGEEGRGILNMRRDGSTIVSLGITPADSVYVNIDDIENKTYTNKVVNFSGGAGGTGKRITIGDLNGSASPQTGILTSEPASGTDISGGTLVIAPGSGTGNATSPQLLFQTPDAGASGSAAQSRSTKFIVSNTSSANNSSITLSAWDGSAWESARVIVGGQNSGGSGFRSLIVDNALGDTSDGIQGNVTYYRNDANAILTLLRSGAVTNTINLGGSRLNIVGNGLTVITDRLDDATAKTSRLGVNHYTVANAPFYGLVFNAQSGDNLLQLGGGTASGMAATRISTYAAANNTTTTGTEVIRSTLAGTRIEPGGVSANPEATAALDVASTSKGFLPPRMTKADRNNIVSPANGLIIYQTDNTPGIRFYENGAWVKPTTSADP